MNTFFKKTKVTIQSVLIKAKWKSSLKPKMTLSGDWITKAGFEIGEQLEVKVEKGKILIQKK